MLYTALGDSITAGVGATSPAHAYPSLIVSMLQTRSIRAIGEVLAHPGWTSASLEWAVLENSPVYLQQASAISIWVGADDLVDAGLAVLHGAPKQTIKRSIERYGRDIVTLVLAIRKVSRRPIILCTQYNPFPNTPIVTEAIGGLNTVTEGVAGRLKTQLAPTHVWFEGKQAELIAGYRTGRIQDVLTSPRPPVHPNNQGHLAIAQGLTPMIRQ
ncbi:SGNH/GDSL hydrolase family protein [Alicyclobacillus ferrooxydans]|uniref:SGNH hydrolase-type esterase domain-containing protein n=1 Tax=Alicyclobacillus ferrooxydans TaxID=471514 RepID=A0A0P9D8M1_9BACL|nr:SGNH/GDSL hydrolase family protein [Alicyclobacillus ferrooxydans]KPV45698.1 hypothetical protein AN477_01990 [Alicyclobacillus ferrooxydans]